MPEWLIPGVTAVLAFTVAVALLDQWLERRRAFQLAWAVGMTLFGIGSGAEAIAAALGWSEWLYRTWYLAGAVLTPAWLGLGTAFLLARTRFGYAYAACFFLAGVFTLLTQRRYDYPDAGASPVLYLIVGVILALAVFGETYFQNERWARIAALGVVVGSIAGIAFATLAPLPSPGYVTDPATGQPTAALFPGYVRLLTPFMNVTGAFSLLFGALFSAYVFMPKRRVLAYSLDPGQPFDQFLFNLVIGAVAVPVNFVASLPLAVRSFRAGTLHSRVLSTILIAAGAFAALLGDSLNRFGVTAPFAIAKLISVALILVGFVISIETFHEIRIPFTRVRIGAARREGEAG
ncbi:MAG: hypothetical protein EPO36_03460 [Chloroflexota bacterium]|nr:MAG: hypothetical protein EPO36_03460 [Chloroflexota bacterium]